MVTNGYQWLPMVTVRDQKGRVSSKFQVQGLGLVCEKRRIDPFAWIGAEGQEDTNWHEFSRTWKGRIPERERRATKNLNLPMELRIAPDGSG
jgi:hypothetical protein